MSGPFTVQLEAFRKKAGDMADEAVGRIVTAIVAEVDDRSPVGDAKYWKHPAPKGYVGGHFRANWQLGIDLIPAGEVAGVDPGGERTTAHNLGLIPERAGGHLYTLTNNVPYAMRIEMGWSHQAPQGVVGLTALKFQQIVDEAVEAVQ